MSIVIVMLITAVWSLIVPSVRSDSESVVDLTHPLNSQTLHWVEARDFELKVVVNGTIRDGEHSYWSGSVGRDLYVNPYGNTFRSVHALIEAILFNTQLSDYVSTDAPCHFAKGKWSVADIPLKNFIDRPVAVIDVVEQSVATRDYEMTKEDLKQWEDKYGEIPYGGVILVRTGWARFWPKKLEYFGTDTNDVLLLHFPGVHPDAAQWLTENRRIVGIGIDGPSIDNGQSKDKKSHRIFAAQNIYHLENIAQTIHELPATGARLTLLPLKIEGASGTPVTVIAKIDSMDSTSGEATVHSLPALIFSLLASFAIFRHIID